MKRFFAIALAGFFAALPGAFACVGCREPGDITLAQESSTVQAGEAFSWSVIFMLAAALAAIGGMAYYIWQTCLRLDRERAVS